MSGRPKGSFSDSAWRMRHWCWVDWVAKIASVDKPSDMDRDPLMKGFLNKKAFLSVQQDGYDPDRINLTKTMSLFQYIKADKRFEVATQVYEHPLWKHLHSRNPSFPEKEEWLAQKFIEFGFVPIYYRDAQRLSSLELQWPEFPEGGRPALDALEKVATQRFVNMDGLLFLLLLYREATDTMDVALAGRIRQKLSDAAFQFNMVFTDELSDTFRYITVSRMLRWLPTMAPSKEELNRATEKLIQQFTDAPHHKGGKRKKHPLLLVRGKVERRWRRKVWVHAVANSNFKFDYCMGYHFTNPFISWLNENRHRIDNQIEWGQAAQIRHREPIDTHDFFINRSDPLEIPVNSTHQRIRFVLPDGEIAFSEPLFHFIDVKLKKIPD